MKKLLLLKQITCHYILFSAGKQEGNGNIFPGFGEADAAAARRFIDKGKIRPYNNLIFLRNGALQLWIMYPAGILPWQIMMPFGGLWCRSAF
jgi:hypothetical protein